jgi:hypothetical protein
VPNNVALNRMVGISFLDFSLMLSFLYLQKIKRNKAAKALLQNIITGVGKFINLPKAPEVLISKVANVSNKSCLLCWFFIVGY